MLWWMALALVVALAAFVAVSFRIAYLEANGEPDEAEISEVRERVARRWNGL